MDPVPGFPTTIQEAIFQYMNENHEELSNYNEAWNGVDWDGVVYYNWLLHQPFTASRA